MSKFLAGPQGPMFSDLSLTCSCVAQNAQAIIHRYDDHLGPPADHDLAVTNVKTSVVKNMYFPGQFGYSLGNLGIKLLKNDTVFDYYGLFGIDYGRIRLTRAVEKYIAAWVFRPSHTELLSQKRAVEHALGASRDIGSPMDPQHHCAWVAPHWTWTI